MAIYVNITGNVASVDELRYLQNGTAVKNFIVASNKSYTDAAGERKSIVTYVRFAMFGKRAESLDQYITKGMAVQIMADNITANAYMGKEGEPRASLQATVGEFNFVNGAGSRSENGSAGHAEEDDFVPPVNEMSDIPF